MGFYSTLHYLENFINESLKTLTEKTECVIINRVFRGVRNGNANEEWCEISVKMQNRANKRYFFNRNVRRNRINKE